MEVGMKILPKLRCNCSLLKFCLDLVSERGLLEFRTIIHGNTKNNTSIRYDEGFDTIVRWAVSVLKTVGRATYLQTQSILNPGNGVG